MAHDPGTHFSYNSSSTFLIGEIVSRVAQESLPEFAKKNLFEPLGIDSYCWTLTPKKRAVAQGSFFIRPRDMLKIGQLFLNQGRWNKQRVISTRWVEESTKSYMDILDNNGENQSRQDGYGYQWWTRCENDSTFDHYFASGNGGQRIHIFPHLNMVVVFTGSHYNNTIGHRQPNEILERYILSAVKAISWFQTLIPSVWASVFGQEPTLRINSITPVSDTRLTFVSGDIIRLQDHGIPEKLAIGGWRYERCRNSWRWLCLWCGTL